MFLKERENTCHISQVVVFGLIIYLEEKIRPQRLQDVFQGAAFYFLAIFEKGTTCDITQTLTE